MREIGYLEVPTPDIDAVRSWLQQEFAPGIGEKFLTPDGIKIQFQSKFISNDADTSPLRKISEISVFVWSVQRTTYLKAFRWANQPITGEKQILQRLTADLRKRFPQQYPEPPNR